MRTNDKIDIWIGNSHNYSVILTAFDVKHWFINNIFSSYLYYTYDRYEKIRALHLKIVYANWPDFIYYAKKNMYIFMEHVGAES